MKDSRQANRPESDNWVLVSNRKNKPQMSLIRVAQVE